jgi:rfaE bifunctional protein nucleotidyltransferase chain/domain
VRRAQRRGERVVFVRSLEQARRLGDRLVVGVNSDASVRRLKGASRPLVPARQRAEVLAALECVDWVVIFPEATPRALIAALEPDVYAKGGDWPLAVLRREDLPEAFAGRVVRLRQIPGIRTTRIVERAKRKRTRPTARLQDVGH